MTHAEARRTRRKAMMELDLCVSASPSELVKGCLMNKVETSNARGGAGYAEKTHDGS